MLRFAKDALRRGSPTAGFSLIELLVACSMLVVLAGVAVPIYRLTIIRQKEVELRRDLREMRNAIDRYKDFADHATIRVEAGNEGYPPDLETLVRGTDITVYYGGRIRFLRKIPVDPMTGKADWGLRSVQDDPDSHSWSGDNVFDVYSKSSGKALDGTNYADW